MDNIDERTTCMPNSALRALTATLVTAALTAVLPYAASASPTKPETTSASSPKDCVRGNSPADLTVTVAFEGKTYSVLAHVPGEKSQRKLPLVLNLHGSGSNGTAQMDLSGFREIADEQNFVVAAPTGDIPLGSPSPALPEGGWAWNVPGVPITSGAYPAPGARNDMAFLQQVVEIVSAELCTDPRRTYATGFSGGGRMVSALACELPDTFAAIAPVAGLRAGQPDPTDLTRPVTGDCQPENPVPVLTFHGTADPVNPFQGNADKRWGYSLPLAAAEWGRLNECRVRSTATVSSLVTLDTWTKCRKGAEVLSYLIAGGGHGWPGAVAPERPETVDHGLNASRIIASFFAEHHLRS
jgi:polyhydroxybutyrate depolymerase